MSMLFKKKLQKFNEYFFFYNKVYCLVNFIIKNHANICLGMIK